MKFSDQRHSLVRLAPQGAGPCTAASMSSHLDADDGDEAVHATGLERCATAALGSLSFMRVRGPAEEACRQAMQAIREERRFPFELLVIRHGSVTASGRAGHSVTLGPDDMALIDGNGATHLLSLDFVDAWIIGLPAPLIARWFQGMPPVTAHRLQGERGWAKVLSAYLRNWEFEQLRGLISPFEKELIGEHVMSLLSMALAQSGAVHETPQRLNAHDRNLYARMRQWVQDNYANPDIGVATLAARFNVSTRYVHKVFLNAGQGETFLDALRSARLEAAALRLQTAVQTQTSVSDIAYGCGFSDAGYFAQVFRRTYGASPSEYARKHDPAQPAAGACAAPG